MGLNGTCITLSKDVLPGACPVDRDLGTGTVGRQGSVWRVSRSNSTVTAPPARRWLQLFAGLLCMIAVANLQYGWTLFVHPLHDKYGWSLGSIQTAFAVFVIAETWLVPFEGWLVDRFGPKFVVLAGGIFVAAAWALNSVADSLWLLYLGAALGGIGAGAVYATCVGNAVRWFPDRRGLAAGITVAGFGGGSALSIIPIQDVIARHGYESAFLWFGLVQGLVVIFTAGFLRTPSPMATVAVPSRLPQTDRDIPPLEMLRSRVFWLLYFMFIWSIRAGSWPRRNSRRSHATSRLQTCPSASWA